MRLKDKQAAVDFMARECVGNQVRMLNRVVTSIYDEALRPLGITASQMVILALTAKHASLRAAQIGEWLQIDASTLSRNMERMRANGWIEEAAASDQRSRPFQLTKAGDKLLHDAVLAWQRAQAEAVDMLGKDGVAQLKAITRTLTRKRQSGRQPEPA